MLASIASDKSDARVIKRIENEFNKLFVWHFIAFRAERFYISFVYFCFVLVFRSRTGFYNCSIFDVNFNFGMMKTI